MRGNFRQIKKVKHLITKCLFFFCAQPQFKKQFNKLREWLRQSAEDPRKTGDSNCNCSIARN